MVEGVSGDTTQSRMTGVTLHSHVHYKKRTGVTLHMGVYPQSVRQGARERTALILGVEIAGRAGVREGVRPWKVNIRLRGKGKSNSHGARPVHQIISLVK